MTLCISLRQSDRSILTLSDSRLTLEAEGKVWTTDQAVKMHYASQSLNAYGSERMDIVFAVSGTLSLGLQSILFVDAYLQGLSHTWDSQIVGIINDKFWDFWSDAISKDISYSIALHGHKSEPKIYEWSCPGGAALPSFKRVEEEHGMLFSVHGDGAEATHARILMQVNACCLSVGCPPEAALPFAAIRELSAAINDPERRYIGGHIQACLLQSNVAKHLICCTALEHRLRSACLDEVAYLRPSYRSLDLMHPWLDSAEPLHDLMQTIPMQPMII